MQPRLNASVPVLSGQEKVAGQDLGTEALSLAQHVVDRHFDRLELFSVFNFDTRRCRPSNKTGFENHLEGFWSTVLTSSVSYSLSPPVVEACVEIEVGLLDP